MLNVAPDRRGLMPDDALARMKEFKSAIDQTSSEDLAAGKKITASNVRGNDPRFAAENLIDGKNETYWASDDNVTSASFEVDLGGGVEFNVVRIEELIELGQRVSEYKLDAFTDGTWREIGRGKTIGHKKLDRVPKVRASKVRLTITKSLACPVIRAFGLHLDTVSPAEFFEPASANKEVVRGTRATSRPRNPSN